MYFQRGDYEQDVPNAQRAPAIFISLNLTTHPHTMIVTTSLALSLIISGNAPAAQRLLSGDVTDLLPFIAEIEQKHREWMAEDPEHRQFGPPPPDEYRLPDGLREAFKTQYGHMFKSD
jgi:hypothetical protein